MKAIKVRELEGSTLYTPPPLAVPPLGADPRNVASPSFAQSVSMSVRPFGDAVSAFGKAYAGDWIGAARDLADMKAWFDETRARGLQLDPRQVLPRVIWWYSQRLPLTLALAAYNASDPAQLARMRLLVTQGFMPLPRPVWNRKTRSPVPTDHDSLGLLLQADSFPLSTDPSLRDRFAALNAGKPSDLAWDLSFIEGAHQEDINRNFSSATWYTDETNGPLLFGDVWAAIAPQLQDLITQAANLDVIPPSFVEAT